MLADQTRTPDRANVRRKAAADRDAIYRMIVTAIRDGRFRAGARLPTERDLAQSHGVARNAVRQALDALVREGTVSRQVGRGTFVTRHPARDPGQADAGLPLHDILEVRLLLEPQVARLVIERATAEDFAAMDRCLDGIRDAADWSAYKEWKYALHLAMMRATRNAFLVQIFEAIIRARREDRWGRHGGDGMIPPEVRAATLRANARIVEALRTGHAEDAADGIRRYLTGIVASVHGV